MFNISDLKPSSQSIVQSINNLSPVSDAFDDLAELKYLLHDLSNLQDDLAGNNISSMNASQHCLNSYNYLIQTAKEKYTEIENLLQQEVASNNLSKLNEVSKTIRQEYLNIKSNLRLAYRQKGTLLCAHDWEAPWHDHPLSATNRNRLHDQITEDAWNYKRDGHLDALAYEQAFAKECLSHLGSPRLETYLTSCCVAAFSTVVHWLTKELHIETKPLFVLPLYCETLIFARQYFPCRTEIKPPSSADLLSALRLHKPQLVFLESITNTDEVLAYDIEAVLDWAKYEAKQETFIIIDTTFLPSPLLNTGFLSGCPDHVTIILLESLAKLQQVGMDLVTAGMVVISTREGLQNSFKDSRRALGTNITDASAGTLPSPNRAALIKRMQRFSRNIVLLATRLESNIKSDGLIKQIVWVKEPAPGMEKFHGSCLVILFRQPFVAIDYYREFEHTILKIAQEQHYALGRGQAFGYDVSRVLVPRTLCEKFLLRLAIGTERASEINTLAEIILKATDELEKKYVN